MRMHMLENLLEDTCYQNPKLSIKRSLQNKPIKKVQVEQYA